MSIQATKNDIDAVQESADSKLKLINDALTSIQSHITEMGTAYATFSQINAKVADEETGLQALLDSATELKSDIIAVKTNADTLYKEIRKFRDDAANYIKEIGGLRDSANAAVNGIQDQHKASVDLKDKIEEIFNIGTRGVHANHFVQRRDMLFWISVFWLGMFLVFLTATTTLAIHYIIPLAETLKDPNARVGVEVFLLRLGVITPTLLGGIYSLKQFSNERRLYEKYAFRAISTYSAESSVKTLARSLEEHISDGKDEKIIDFAVKIFTNLYQEPVEPMHDRWIFRTNNKLLDLTAEVNQSIGEIKKDVDRLADNIPGDKSDSS